ncbi:hypothetical protein CN984_26370 [Bacillus cereus]|uniref:Uncharacterized protein n=1 Tax=Bacillus cereus TaxID=1396 RepID=A0A2B9PIN6_BACCE|nr:hypothetical protein [Bacillus cereus]PEV97728.1 hypothetical protein CN428_24615 [Bacillus cereus]PGO22518.1 hypothetical protein CN984_26370 [Bacillus cereus]HDR7624026.1 hypothetical protein [Bacillus mycoides]HDR7630379.1 hypothetical protein [Bacillus mycoides]
MKKIGLTIVGLSVLGITSLGLGHTNEIAKTKQKLVAVNIGDTWSPQRTDLAYSHGHTGGSPEYTHGEGWSPAYTHGEPWGIADGNTGAPAYDHGRPPAPTNTHGETII